MKVMGCCNLGGLASSWREGREERGAPGPRVGDSQSAVLLVTHRVCDGFTLGCPRAFSAHAHVWGAHSAASKTLFRPDSDTRPEWSHHGGAASWDPHSEVVLWVSHLTERVFTGLCVRVVICWWPRPQYQHWSPHSDWNFPRIGQIFLHGHSSPKSDSTQRFVRPQKGQEAKA